MRGCVECGRVKFWFQMYSRFVGLYTEVFPICRSCASDLTYRVVSERTEQRPQPQSLVDRVTALESKMAQILPELR